MAAISELIVFGDSLSDTGNAYAQRGDAAFPCPPHWQGRRCDGPVWVERLADGLGLPAPRPSLAGGSNHAFGGARSGAGLSPKGLPNLLEQVAGFLGEGAGLDASPASPGRANRRPAVADPAAFSAPAGPGDRRTPPAPGALVLLRAGANDYLDAPPSAAVGDAVNQHLLTAVERLAAAGFRRFLVPSELPWGFSPIQRPGLGEAERRGLNALIARQNALLQEALVALAARRDLVVVQPDVQALFLAVRADPAAHGFSEIERPVLELGGGGPPVAAAVAAALSTPSGPVPAATPARSPAPAWSAQAAHGHDAAAATPAGAGHLWWDSWAHLSTAFHALLAAAALRALDAERWAA